MFWKMRTVISETIASFHGRLDWVDYNIEAFFTPSARCLQRKVMIHRFFLVQTNYIIFGYNNCTDYLKV